MSVFASFANVHVILMPLCLFVLLPVVYMIMCLFVLGVMVLVPSFIFLLCYTYIGYIFPINHGGIKSLGAILTIGYIVYCLLIKCTCMLFLDDIINDGFVYSLILYDCVIKIINYICK